MGGFRFIFDYFDYFDLQLVSFFENAMYTSLQIIL